MNANVSGIMKQLVPAFLTAKPAASRRIGADAGGLEARENRVEIPPAFGMVHVDVDLLARERRPQQHAFAVRSSDAA